jgi:dihydrofolate reductase
MLSIIVAAAENGVIGVNNTLPWKIPADLARFKQLTMGKPIIMGRKTFDSLGRVLPGRPHIVISRHTCHLPDNCYLVHSVPQAIEKASELAHDAEIMVIGGGEIYRQALDVADKIYLTRVHAEFDGDAYFHIAAQHWVEVASELHEGSPRFSFITYQRKIAG